MLITVLNVLLFILAPINLVFAIGNFYNKQWFQGGLSLFVAVFCVYSALR